MGPISYWFIITITSDSKFVRGIVYCSESKRGTNTMGVQVILRIGTVTTTVSSV